MENKIYSKPVFSPFSRKREKVPEGRMRVSSDATNSPKKPSSVASRHRGSALITALFIMTIVAIAATAMSKRLQLDIYRTQMVLNSDRLYLATGAVLGWAKSELNANPLQWIAQDKLGTVAYYPARLENIYPNAIIKGQLIDMQARFNLNNLNDKASLSFFETLIMHVAKQTDAIQRRSIIDATSAWIHPYNPAREQDAYLDDYLKKTPPYYPAYQPMADVSELRWVHGVNNKVYQALLPYVIALPEPTPINLNTAPLTVLMGLGHGLDASQAHELLAARGKKGLTDIATISPLLKKLDIPNQQITLESQYFLSQAIASIDHRNLTVYTLLKRQKDKKGIVRVMVLSEWMNG